METLLTYDISSRHVEFKTAMLNMGYRDRLILSNGTMYFPNTTWYHPTKLVATIIEDCKSVCNNLSIRLIRCVATQWEPNWEGILGESF